MLGHGSGFDSPGFKELRRVAKPLGEQFHAAQERAGLTLVEVYTRGRELEACTSSPRADRARRARDVWRVRHFKVVQRVIGGDVIGTQGTPVEVMGRLIHHSFYPELWDVRQRADPDEPARMSKVALGCVNFGGLGSAPAFFGQGIAHDEAFAIMDRAWDAGITWFDTGDAYGGGTSERWIGEWIRARGVRPKLTTKVFHSTTGTPGDRARAGSHPPPDPRLARAARRRQGRLYLAHEPDPAMPLGETIACFESLRDKGLIGAWGLSNHDLAEIRGTAAGARSELVLAARAGRRGGRAAALPRARDPVRAVRAARRRLADRQVPARRGVPRGLAHDAAARAVRALRRRAGVRRAGRAGRRGRIARRVDGGARVRVGARTAATAPCAARTAPRTSTRCSRRCRSN